MLTKVKTILKATLVASVVATSFLAVPTTAQAQSGVRADGSYQVADHRGRNGRDDWRRHRGGGGDWRGHNGYRNNRYYGGRGYYYRDNNNYGAAAAAGIIGLAAGAMIANSANQPRYYNGGGYGGDYVSYCSNRYRSFNPRTGMFTGYDGYQHRCVMP
ncbi:BA14K family protein [Kaistia terrae]|jgi:hypothetical protein|uniref:Lectin-like protein BA14k n=1 Tax=Kaistia terrae TaxID=537017 RepID=A0ABW0PSG9_9HYPH|nr:BA14K family protein [Kaistia terrae]MCX5578354.1 BA14K family protein [Kaistia terrae]